MKNLIQMNYLKKITIAVLFLAIPLFTLSCDDDDDNDMDTSSKTITELAASSDNLSTLYDALKASGLDAALNGDGPFTVFAPSNEAFAALDPATLNNIISTPSLLTALLQYHVVGAEVFSSDLSNGPVQTLLSGQTVDVNVSGGSVTLNGSSKVTNADIEASNGVIHIIDEVLLPEDFYAQTLAGIVASSPVHKILLSALSKPELSDLLAAANDPTQDLTVFAPTDAAFEGVLAALGKESIDDIPVELLKEIVTYHILGTNVTSDELVNGDVPTLLPGESVTVDITDGVKINNANVTVPDLKAVNGVAHVVDAVLLPSYVVYSLGTVAEPVLFEKGFTTLASALRKADLLETVATTPNLTVFAPDNAGFVAAGITNLDDYTVEELTTVLTYHVLGAVVKAADLPASGIAATLNGENIYLGYLNQGRVLINGLTEIIAVDIEKSNGVVHVINRTLVPPAPNVVEIAVAFSEMAEDAEFTVLVSLLSSPDYADITQALIDAESITVFAPTDEAFGEINNGAGLSVAQISEVLLYHATPGRQFSTSLSEGQTIGMLNQQNITVASISGEDIALKDSTDDNANVLEVNVHGSNGLIHVLDKVLIPEL